MFQALEVTPSMLTNHKGKEAQTFLHKKCITTANFFLQKRLGKIFSLNMRVLFL